MCVSTSGEPEIDPQLSGVSGGGIAIGSPSALSHPITSVGETPDSASPTPAPTSIPKQDQLGWDEDGAWSNQLTSCRRESATVTASYWTIELIKFVTDSFG